MKELCFCGSRGVVFILVKGRRAVAPFSSQLMRVVGWQTRHGANLLFQGQDNAIQIIWLMQQGLSPNFIGIELVIEFKLFNDPMFG